MSKYTTEVRFICETLAGKEESEGYNSVNEIIANSRNSIFDFEYPIFDEAYRSVLETKILKHFYTREIGFETVGLWKLKLDTKLNEIMPYYNKLYKSELLEFNPLLTTNLEKEHTGDLTDTGTVSDDGGNTNVLTKGTSRLEKFSDTPQGAVENLENGTYLTNASQAIMSGSDTDRLERHYVNTRNLASTDHYIENITGISNANASDLLIKFRNTFLNIDLQIINDLEELFLQLW